MSLAQLWSWPIVILDGSASLHIRSPQDRFPNSHRGIADRRTISSSITESFLIPFPSLRNKLGRNTVRRDVTRDRLDLVYPHTVDKSIRVTRPYFDEKHVQRWYMDTMERMRVRKKRGGMTFVTRGMPEAKQKQDRGNDVTHAVASRRLNSRSASSIDFGGGGRDYLPWVEGRGWRGARGWKGRGRTRHNERSSQPIRVSNSRVGRELISLRESCFRTRERERERERRRECTFRLVEMTRGDDRENMNGNFTFYLLWNYYLVFVNAM